MSKAICRGTYTGKHDQDMCEFYKISHTIFLLLFFATIILFLPGSGRAEKNEQDFKWRIFSKNETVTIYKGEKRASGIIPIKFDAIVDYPPSRVRSVLSATRRRPEWVPNMLEARIVERIGRYEKIEYLRYDFPWPFFDRSFILHTSTSFDPESQTLFTRIKSVDYPEVPRNRRYVRAHTYLGTTLTRPDASGQKTYLEVMFLTDMEGSIPKWIVNEIQAGWPEKIVNSLLKQLARDDIDVLEKWKLIDETGRDAPAEG